jgi:hypothetical protein
MSSAIGTGHSLSTQEKFHHKRLSSERAIRILTLHPSLTFKSSLIVTLKEVLLDAVPESGYEALSYVWGSPMGRHPIQCDGCLLYVTPNCESALRHLRKERSERILWIDAICIDQEDGLDSLHERNAQVAAMGEIYSKATTTFCWFGEGLDFTRTVFERMRRIGECQSQRELKKLLLLDGVLW